MQPYYSFMLGEYWGTMKSISASYILQLAFKIVWACPIWGGSGSTHKTNGQGRGKQRESERDETETEESEGVEKVKVSNNRVVGWQLHLASVEEEWSSSMSPRAGLKRCPLQHTAH